MIGELLQTKMKGKWACVATASVLATLLLAATGPAMAANNQTISRNLTVQNGCPSGGWFTKACPGTSTDIAAMPTAGTTGWDAGVPWNDGDTLTVSFTGHVEDWDDQQYADHILFNVTAIQLENNASQTWTDDWTAGTYSMYQADVTWTSTAFTLSCTVKANCAGISDAWTVIVTITFDYQNCGQTWTCHVNPPPMETTFVYQEDI